jgi:hypothetical protein|tara:strand:- start:3684 stop:3950 length:267 start_codon:yes stop_codon:yes gene_type:complete
MVKKRISSSGSKLRAHAFAHALGILALISLIFYALFVWFGGYNGLEVASSFPIGFDFDNLSFLFGLVQAYVIWYVGGWIFVKVYNRSS